VSIYEKICIVNAVNWTFQTWIHLSIEHERIASSTCPTCTDTAFVCIPIQILNNLHSSSLWISLTLPHSWNRKQNKTKYSSIKKLSITAFKSSL